MEFLHFLQPPSCHVLTFSVFLGIGDRVRGDCELVVCLVWWDAHLAFLVVLFCYYTFCRLDWPRKEQQYRASRTNECCRQCQGRVGAKV